MLVGLLIGAVAIRAALKAPATVALCAPVAILTVPLFDTAMAIVRRKLTGRSIYATDRAHLHHCLLRRGLSNRRVLLLVSFFSVVAAGGALVSVCCRSELLAVLAMLADRCGLAEAVQDVGIAGLSVVPCGKLPANPAELPTSARLQELIHAVREQYDFVLIDTPPLLAVTDASAVAPRVDGVLLTLRITKNGRPHAERAKDMLQTLGVPVFGVVVNGVAARGTGYGGYGYYKEGYTYYSRDYSYNGKAEDYYEGKEEDPADGAQQPTSADANGGSNGVAPDPEGGNGRGQG
jgi:hypothetical protein